MPPKPKHISEYHVFLASPGDVEQQRQEVRDFFDEYNRHTAAEWGVRFVVLDWEHYATAGVGEPQKRITADTLEKFRDSLVLVIGLLNQRFGSPTSDHESGTEEEFQWALDRHNGTGDPEIKWFFKKVENFVAPTDRIDDATQQWKKVREFQAQLRSKDSKRQLFYKQFNNNEDFIEVFRNDLSLWLNSSQRPWRQNLPGRIADVVAQGQATGLRAAVQDVIGKIIDGGESAIQRIARLGQLHSMKLRPEDTEGVIEYLVNQQVLTVKQVEPNQSVVELDYAQIISQHPHLKPLLDEDAEFMLWHRRFYEHARLWLASAHRKFLLRDPLLSEAESWLLRQPARFNPGEIALIQRSLRYKKVRWWRKKIIYSALAIVISGASIYLSVKNHELNLKTQSLDDQKTQLSTESQKLRKEMNKLEQDRTNTTIRLKAVIDSERKSKAMAEELRTKVEDLKKQTEKIPQLEKVLANLTELNTQYKDIVTNKDSIIASQREQQTKLKKALEDAEGDTAVTKTLLDKANQASLELDRQARVAGSNVARLQREINDQAKRANQEIGRAEENRKQLADALLKLTLRLDATISKSTKDGKFSAVLSTNAPTKLFDAHGNVVELGSNLTAVAFSPNDQILAVGTMSGVVETRWLTNSSNPMAAYHIGDQAIEKIAFAEDSTRIGILSSNMFTLVGISDTNRPLWARELVGPNPVEVSFDATEGLVVVSTPKGEKRAWRLSNGEPVGARAKEVDGVNQRSEAK